jgi:hypothetical protein
VNQMTRNGTRPGADWWHKYVKPIAEMLDAQEPYQAGLWMNWVVKNHPDVTRLLGAYHGVREIQGLSKWGDPKTDPKAVNYAFNQVWTAMINNNFNEAVRLLQRMPDELRSAVLQKILEMSPADSLLKHLSLTQVDQLLKNAPAQIPQQLQKQMAGIAPGPWNPPGKMPIPAYLGTEAHKAIAEEYDRRNQPDRTYVNRKSMSWILKSLGGNLKGLDEKYAGMQPDIVNITKKHLYEIKPVKQLQNAVVESALYTAIFNECGIKMYPGAMDALGTMGTIPAPGGVFVYWSPMPGVIVYEYKRGSHDPIPFPKSFEIKEEEKNPIEAIGKAVGLTGGALILYLIISEGSRVVFPLRNLIPVP